MPLENNNIDWLTNNKDNRFTGLHLPCVDKLPVGHAKLHLLVDGSISHHYFYINLATLRDEILFQYGNIRYAVFKTTRGSDKTSFTDTIHQIDARSFNPLDTGVLLPDINLLD